MRNILGKIVLMSAVVATTFAANAASSQKRFQVPFSFTVAGQTWPAGTYLIAKNSFTDNVLLQSVDSTKMIALTLGPGDPSPSDRRVILTFAEEDQNHALKSVQYGPLVGSLSGKHGKQLEQRPVRTVQGQ